MWRWIARSAVAALVGCTPTETEPSPNATFQATWADGSWLGSAWMLLSGDTLFIGGVEPPGASQTGSGPVPQTTVEITVAPFAGPGSYDASFTASLIYLIGGDVISAAYSIDSTASRVLSIDRFSDTEVSGSVTFRASSTSDHSPAGPRARFTGTFTASIPDHD